MPVSPAPSLLPPQLPAGELAQLALASEASVRAAVAGHTNTPPAVLGTLAAEFPAEVLRNPALPLLRLAQPKFMLGWPVSSLLALLRQPDAPGWLRRLLRPLPSTEIQVALAGQAQLEAAEVAELARHPAWLVRARIAARPDLPPVLLSQLRHDPDDSVRLAVACRTDLPATDLLALQGDPSRYVQQAAKRAAGAREGAAPVT